MRDLLSLKKGDIFDEIKPEPPLDLTHFPETRWLIVQSEPGREMTLAGNLTLRRVPFYMPTFVKSARIDSRIYKPGMERPDVHRPLFPGLIFVTEQVAAAAWSTIACAYGVSYSRPFMEFGPGLAFVYPDQMEIIRGIEQIERETYLAKRNADAAGKVVIRFSVGDKVRVRLNQMFGGKVGAIGEIDDAGRITVLMDIMKRKVRVRMTRDQVEAV